MREILFRGKRIDNGEWIRGDLITTPFIRNTTQQNIIYILDVTKADYDCFEDLVEDNGIFEVDPETVCQYTGLSDRNGKRIFEGDVVRNFLCIDDHNEPLYEYGKVVYIPERISFEIWDDDNNQITTTAGLEVIGNIFDNPELIGEQP